MDVQHKLSAADSIGNVIMIPLKMVSVVCTLNQ